MSKYLDKCLNIFQTLHRDPSPPSNAAYFVTFLALQSQNSHREKDKLIRSRVRSLAQKIISILERNELLLFLSFISYSYKCINWEYVCIFTLIWSYFSNTGSKNFFFTYFSSRIHFFFSITVRMWLVGVHLYFLCCGRIHRIFIILTIFKYAIKYIQIVVQKSPELFHLAKLKVYAH